MKYNVCVLLALVLCAAGSLRAAEEKKETKVADISHADLASAVKEKKVVLIDCNGSETYNKGHIPGAVDFTAEKEIAKKLPEDKNALVVAYCGSEKCTAYKSGAEAALKLGYTNVKHYAPGLAGWKKSGEQLASADEKK